jgi:hypothetical protein
VLILQGRKQSENVTDVNELLAELRSDKGVSSDVPGAQKTDVDMEEESPEDELFNEPQFTWSGCLDVDSQMEGGSVQRIRDVEALFQHSNTNGTEHNRAGESSYLLSGSRTGEPFIISRRGCEFEDLNDVDFFPKAFPKLFPFGVGGPRTASVEDSWGLLPWARLCLQRHGRNTVFIPLEKEIVANINCRWAFLYTSIFPVYYNGYGVKVA